MMNTSEQRIQCHLEALAQFTATPGQGTTRMSYSAQAQQARAYLKQEMAAAGLTVREDAIGNVFGRLEGDLEGQENLPPVMLGSHFDSVPHGGPFDGPAGVVAALEAATRFHELGLKPRYPLEVVALVEEEGASFGAGLFASRAMTGGVSVQDLHQLKDAAGISAHERMLQAGYQPEHIASVIRQKGDIKAFLELHIEQGPVLENAHEDVGLVDVIAGITQLTLTLTGHAGHAGTTPMTLRADALLAATTLVQAVAQWAIQADEGTVATVGRLNVYPNGANIIPQQVELTVDIRSKNEAKLQWVIGQVRQWAAQISSHSPGIQCQLEQKIYISPTVLDPAIHALLVKHSEKLGLKHRTMASGAGHDAMIFASICPVGLIFVPSRVGLSHHPDEWTDYAQIKTGADLMFETARELTQASL